MKAQATKNITFLTLMILLALPLVNCPGDGALFDLGSVSLSEGEGDGGGEGDGSLNDGSDDGSDGSDDGTSTCQSYATYTIDEDGDGYGSNATDAETKEFEACSDSAPDTTGYASNSSDCDDSDADINPEALDVLRDGIDQDCTGADKYLVSVTYYTDEDLDTDPESSATYTYNESGQNTGIIRDHDIQAADGNEYEQTLTYDTDGNLSTQATTNVLTSSTTVISRTEYLSYDSAGNYTERNYYKYSTHSETYDLYTTATYTYSYITGTDHIDTTATDTVFHYLGGTTYSDSMDYDYSFYDSDEIEYKYTDKSDDGSINVILYFEYDDDGNMTYYSKDSDGDADGSRDPDMIYTYEWENGLMTKEAYYQTSSSTTVPSWEKHYTYDEYGTQSGSFVDRDQDGEADEDQVTSEITYNE